MGVRLMTALPDPLALADILDEIARDFLAPHDAEAMRQSATALRTLTAKLAQVERERDEARELFESQVRHNNEVITGKSALSDKFTSANAALRSRVQTLEGALQRHAHVTHMAFHACDDSEDDGSDQIKTERDSHEKLDEAIQGLIDDGVWEHGEDPVMIALSTPCEFCKGTGWVTPLSCPECEGRGYFPPAEAALSTPPVAQSTPSAPDIGGTKSDGANIGRIPFRVDPTVPADELHVRDTRTGELLQVLRPVGETPSVAGAEEKGE